MRRSAVTLLEVLVTVGIIAFLVTLAFGAVQKARLSALILKSENNLRQIGMAHASYVADRGLVAPFAENTILTKSQFYSTTQPTYLFLELLPYLDQTPLHELLTNQSAIGAKNIEHRKLAAGSCNHIPEST